MAVTATHVSIGDPTTPTRISHVDSSGRLTTAGLTANYATFSEVEPNYTAHPVTSPTTASLGLTELSHSSDNDNATQGVGFRMYLTARPDQPL